MGLFKRRKGAGAGVSPGSRSSRPPREAVEEVRRHFEDFVATRRGVEAFIEPPTTVTPTTLLLIATDGEWTRRRVFDPAVIHHLAGTLHVPVYDVRLVGYPQRMRDYNARVRLEERKAQRARDQR